MKKLTLIIAVTISAFTGTAQDQTAKDIVYKVYNRTTPNNGESDMKMTLINKKGSERTRELHQYFIDLGNEEKQIMFFTSPADVKNTSFMNWSYDDVNKSDDQWLYLPALKKVKRISSSNKDNEFMGSDFTYEDMERKPVDKYEHRLLGSQKIQGLDCWILESRPKKEAHSAYSLMRSMIIKDIYVSLQTEYFDKKKKHWKTYQVLQLENIQGIWTETKVMMTDLLENHKTILTTKQIKYNTGLKPSIFTTQNLKTW